METPRSVRLKKQGKKLDVIAKRRGVKIPDMLRFAVEVLLERYPNEDELVTALFAFRAEEAREEAAGSDGK